MFRTCKLSSDVDIFEFLVGNYFGYFFQKWANLFSNHLITLLWANLNPGNTKEEVSLYRWPPVWLLWNQLYDNWQFMFYFSKQSNPKQSNRRSMVEWFFPFSIPCLIRLTSSQQQQLVITVMIRKHHLKGRDNQNIRSFAGATAFSITTFSITTFSIRTLSMKGFLDTSAKWPSA